MAHRTIGRNPKGHVVGIQALTEIRTVTTVTSIGRIRIIPLVTGVAIIGYGHVRTCERVDGIVIKSRRRPNSFAVASGTIRGKLSCCMVGAGCSGIIAVVTAVAGIGCVVIVAVVAGCAIVGDGGMCPI